MSLDPITNRELLEDEAAKKREEMPLLNPEFPYKREAFDPVFFGLTKMRGTEEE